MAVTKRLAVPTSSDPFPRVRDPRLRARLAAFVWYQYRSEAARLADEAQVGLFWKLQETPPLDVLDALQTKEGWWNVYVLGHQDGAGVWWPNPTEVAPCCYVLRPVPLSTAPPVSEHDEMWRKRFGAWARWAYMKHCKSLPHVAHRLGVKPVAARRELKRMLAMVQLASG